MHLVRALRDCNQRSLTVSKKAPTVSKKASPISSLRCFRAPDAPTRIILVYAGMLLVPLWPQIMQIRISFRSRSHLVLDADHALDFFLVSRFTGVYLVL